MKRQQPPFVRHHARFVHAENFPGFEKYHRGIGIVVILATAAATAVRAFFDEQHGIEFEFHGLLLQIRVFQIDDTCLGMQCFTSQTAVAFSHALDVQRLFHLSFQPIIFARYSFGVHPARFLNRRHRCCGYWNPRE